MSRNNARWWASWMTGALLMQTALVAIFRGKDEGFAACVFRVIGATLVTWALTALAIRLGWFKPEGLDDE